MAAKDLGEFVSRYETWLTALKTDGLIASLGFEKVQALVTDGNEAGLLSYLEDFFGAGNVEIAYEHSTDFAENSVYSHTVFAELADLLGTPGHDEYTLSSQGDDFINVNGNVTGVDFTFNGGGHDVLHVGGNYSGDITNIDAAGTTEIKIDGNYSGNGIIRNGDENKVYIGGQVEGTINTGAGNDVVNIGVLASGSVNTGAGDDWIVLAGSQTGTIVDGGAGNNSLQLTLGSNDDMEGKFDLSGIKNIGHLWLDMNNDESNIIDDAVLAKAFASVSDVQDIHVLRDASDSINLSAWTKGSSVVHQGMNNETIAFDAYTQISGDDTLTIYIQSL